LSFHSFVRPAPRAFFRPDRIFPSPSRAAAVKDGASSAPPKACPCMGLSKSSTYFTAFSTSFIPVSLFDLESRFFAPTHTWWTPARTGAVKVGRRSALSARSVVSRPRLDRPEHGGTLVVVGMTRPRGARCRGTRDSCRNLVSGGSATRTMMHACASAAKLRGGGPILNGGIEAVDKRGTPPPRTVIASPSRTSGRERSHNL
jgi:hypothetical protein